MKKWLKKLQAPKFYRYWYYRQYVFSVTLGDDVAEYSSAIGSALVTCCHFSALIYLLTSFLFPEINDFLFSGRSAFEILIYFAIFLIINYFWFLYYNKWKSIICEFKTESKREKRNGNLYLLIYLFFSLLGYFPIVFWITGLI